MNEELDKLIHIIDGIVEVVKTVDKINEKAEIEALKAKLDKATEALTEIATIPHTGSAAKLAAIVALRELK